MELTLKKINNDIFNQLEKLDSPTGNTFILTYNNYIINDKIKDWLNLWGLPNKEGYYNIFINKIKFKFI